MKRNIILWALCSIFTLAAFSACEETTPAPVEPIFPTAVLNETIAAGESVNVEFTPNVDWEISLSGEGSGNYFWIDDAGINVTKLNGKAQESSVVITVVFSEDEEFDTNRVCDVILKMGEDSKTIATITRLALGRTFDLSVAVADETGFTEGYEKAESINLVTFEDVLDYTVPVRVVSNYAWNLALPSWLVATELDGESNVSGGEAGTTDFLLTAVLSEDVINGTEGILKFVDTVNTEAVEEITATLPSVLDRVEYTLTTTFSFNPKGDVMGAGGSYVEGVPAVFELVSTPETSVKVVEWNDEDKYYDIKFAEWATVTSTLYPDFTENDILARYNVEIAVTENTASSERFADVFVIPASKADVAFDDWFDPNTGNLKSEFEAYIIGRISQTGIDKDFITLSEDPMDVESFYEASLTKYTEQQWWSGRLGTTNIYELVYSNEYSDAVLVFDSPVASYEVYDYDFQLVSEADLDSFWLGINVYASDLKGRVSMDPESFDNVNAEFPESFIVLYDENDKVLAGISCRFTSQSSAGEGSFTVVSGSAEITTMDESSEIYQFLASEYSISEVYQLTTGDKNITLNTTLDFWSFAALDPATMQDLSYDDCPITLEPANPSIYCMMNGLTEKTEVIFIFKGQYSVNLAAIYFIYDPAAAGASAPFSFQYPDMVSGATLEKYTGETEGLLSEHWGLTADNIYALTYTSAYPSMAMINVPAMPAFDAAWGNESGSSSYWLTYEQQGDNVILVNMTETGKTDYFVFRNADGYTCNAILICTYEPAN